jgi:hypothetical protein
VRQLLSVVLALLSLAGALRGDVLLPGTRPVSHQLVIEPSELWAGRRIVAFPVRGFGGAHLVEPGRPFDFSSKYGTRLYVAVESEPVPESVDRDWAAGRLAAEIPVREIASVPLTSPLESLVTTLRILRLDGAHFELAVVDQTEQYDPSLVAVLCALALLAASGLVYAIRRRRRTAAAS